MPENRNINTGPGGSNTFLAFVVGAVVVVVGIVAYLVFAGDRVDDPTLDTPALEEPATPAPETAPEATPEPTPPDNGEQPAQ